MSDVIRAHGANALQLPDDVMVGTGTCVTVGINVAVGTVVTVVNLAGVLDGARAVSSATTVWAMLVGKTAACAVAVIWAMTVAAIAVVGGAT